jgi:hypothetical protein
MMQIVCERLTNQPQPSYQNGAMLWGIEQEPYARMAYEVATGELVEEVGFLAHPALAWIGCSPDGLIGQNGGLEIKCPHSTAVHIATLRNGMPPEHMAQIQGCMFVTGRQWWDFVSFDPRLPEHLQIYVQRVERDEKYIAGLALAISLALSEVEETINELNQRGK